MKLLENNFSLPIFQSTQETVINGSNATNLQAISCGEFGSPQDESIDIIMNGHPKGQGERLHDSRKEKSLNKFK